MISREKIDRVLIVGSWAKEQITVENLKRYGGYTVYAYMDTPNPGIEKAADGTQVGELEDIRAITDYAREVKADLVLVTTAAPLAAGLVDQLEQEGIVAFGPDRSAARLETNKAFCRRLLEKYLPRAVPDFQVFSQVEPALAWAREKDWQVVIKPLGLTDGLGVRAFGEQLMSPGEVEEYVRYIIDEAYSGHNEVIVEEWLEGEEFTVQCLVNGTSLVSTPAVQDFKKLLPRGKGPNTASMGSISGGNHLVPFLGLAHYGDAVRIIRDTLSAYKQETGHTCRGFLYGQFMLTSRGIKLIEFNFRPGDPEWLNVMQVLQEDLLKGIEAVMHGEEATLCFRRNATVCKYIVPLGYPKKAYATLAVDLDRDDVRRSGVRIYHSCGRDSEGRLNVGTERGLAFLAEATSIGEASRKVEYALECVGGSFRHRADIGTGDLIQFHVDHVRELTRLPDKDVRICPAQEKDFTEVFDLVRRCPPLEAHGAHLYRIMIRYFRDCCYVARVDGRMVGWLLTMRPTVPPGTSFLWQIGVDPDLRGSGVAGRLLQRLEANLRRSGAERIELTIDPDNIPSIKFFEKNGFRNRSESESDIVARVNGFPAVVDFYGPGRHFLVMEKLLT